MSGKSLSPPLAGMRVLVLTSGHEALDARVYGREAVSVGAMGASVTVVGKLTRGTPGTVEVLPVTPPSSRLARFLLSPWRCLWRARRLRPDIVHFHDAEVLAILPVARLLWPRAKFVYDVHEDFANLMLIRDWFPDLLKPMVRALTDAGERSLARLVHGIVAVTPPLAVKFPHAHRVSARNFPTADFFASARSAARPMRERSWDLVHLGTLSRPRAIFLAEVMNLLKRRRPQARCLVLGASAEIMEFLRERLPEGSQARGAVAHDQVAAVLGEARVGIDVHPWLQPHLLPALAVKVGEYLACGCAVVASSMPVLEEVLARAEEPLPGIVTIEGGNPEDYAAATDRLLTEIENGADSAVARRRFAEAHMNWQNEALRIRDLYRALVGDGSCAA